MRRSRAFVEFCEAQAERAGGARRSKEFELDVAATAFDTLLSAFFDRGAALGDTRMALRGLAFALTNCAAQQPDNGAAMFAYLGECFDDLYPVALAEHAPKGRAS